MLEARPKSAFPDHTTVSPKCQVYCFTPPNFTGPVRERIKGIAKAQKFPAAIAEMKKLLTGKGAPTKAAKAAPAKKTVVEAAPRKLKITPKRKAQLKLQGVYIGMIRSLPDAQKAKIKTLAKVKGFGAAVAVMRKAAASR